MDLVVLEVCQVVGLRLGVMASWRQLEGHLCTGGSLELLHACVVVVGELFHAAALAGRLVSVGGLSGLLVCQDLGRFVRTAVM